MMGVSCHSPWWVRTQGVRLPQPVTAFVLITGVVRGGCAASAAFTEGLGTDLWTIGVKGRGARERGGRETGGVCVCVCVCVRARV